MRRASGARSRRLHPNRCPFLGRFFPACLFLLLATKAWRRKICSRGSVSVIKAFFILSQRTSRISDAGSRTAAPLAFIRQNCTTFDRPLLSYANVPRNSCTVTLCPVSSITSRFAAERGLSLPFSFPFGSTQYGYFRSWTTAISSRPLSRNTIPPAANVIRARISRRFLLVFRATLVSSRQRWMGSSQATARHPAVSVRRSPPVDGARPSKTI
jgi:hypothetical protein